MTRKVKRGTIGQLMPSVLKNLLEARGVKFVQQIGTDVLRQVVFDVMCGRNLRDATEMLTRKHIALVNAALVVLFMQGLKYRSDFVSRLADIVNDELQQKHSKTERWVLQWLLGLTDKAAQNILRDDLIALETYKEQYMRVCQEVVAECERNFGTLKGALEISSGEWAHINWEFLYYLLNAVGAGTLAIRGSENQYMANFLNGSF
ncbi:hypothetical protein HRbin17_02232 [bacterium HR17]|uniref:Uncharacterized protein n=1 Tax=Candidatus Fervidibacter japonicus TaxID=2035412 RepID=A0A2H5XEU3_9BACT|nr:hypothetical protein HRbin17_02232 [bacterium HR17]